MKNFYRVYSPKNGGFGYRKASDSNNIKHKLTHQTLYLSFWKVDVNTPIINGVKISDIKNYPFPVPIKNFINDFINAGN